MSARTVREYLRQLAQGELTALERLLDHATRQMQSELSMVKRELKRRKRAARPYAPKTEMVQRMVSATGQEVAA